MRNYLCIVSGGCSKHGDGIRTISIITAVLRLKRSSKQKFSLEYYSIIAYVTFDSFCSVSSCKCILPNTISNDGKENIPTDNYLYLSVVFKIRFNWFVLNIRYDIQVQYIK